MGIIDNLVIFYGRGEELFSELLRAADDDIRSSRQTDLCQIMARHGSDKSSTVHNYTPVYDRLFSGRRATATDVFELGIGTNFADVPSNMTYRDIDAMPGASLRGWREYFDAANICGADIDHRVIFQEHRIQTLYVDQTDAASISSLWEHVPLKFDVIVDDGLHEFAANREFMNGSKDQLKPDGLYIIEDIVSASEIIIQYDKYFDRSEMSGFLYRIPLKTNQYNNTISVMVNSN